MRRSSEERLLRLAREQFKLCEDFEGAFKLNFINDVQFANADPDNAWQWPGELWRNRQIQNKVTLTINQVRVFNDRILNEMKKNPPGIIVRPTGGGATVQSAKAYSNWMREITRRSRFANIVTRAARFQVDGGVCYWRVLTEYEDDEAFTQRIYIASVKNMMAVYLDPDAKEPDRSDSKFGFIFEDVLKSKIHKQYPNIKDFGSSNAVGSDYTASWMTGTHYRVAEWYNLEMVADTLVMMIDDDGKETTEYLSRIPENLREEILADPMTQRRKVQRKQMKWRKIIGQHIVDERDWPGIYVPIVQAVGDEIIVDGELDRKGNTRLMKDAQRMLNYWASAATGSVALQTKVPWLTDIRAIEGYETYYASANNVDHAYLPYKSIDANGQPIAPPTKIPPPEMSPAYVTGMQIADRQLQSISGQRDPSRDEVNDNLKSGRALLVRRAEGDMAKAGFRDNIDIAVAYTGRIIIDLIKSVYDTPRQIMTVTKSNEENEINLDPTAATPYAEQDIPDAENAKKIIFNPNVGKYDVDADSGPDFATQREYAVEAMSTIVATNNELWGTIGDLLVQNMDFPGADEMAERLRRTIPKAVLGEGPDADMQQLMAQNQHLTSLIENFTALLAEKNLLLKNKDEEITLKAFDSETKRIKELGNAQENFEALGIEGPVRDLILKTLKKAGNTLPSEVTETDDPDMTGANADTANDLTPPGLPKPNASVPVPTPVPTHPNGKIAPDGKEYVEHQPGKFAQVEPQTEA